MFKLIILLLSTLLLCQEQVLGYDYKANLTQIIQDMDAQLDGYKQATLMTFGQTETLNVKSQFDMLAYTVASSAATNPYAYAHVIEYRKNYTSVSYICDSMINDTRNAIISTFDQQRLQYAKTLPQVRKTADDVYAILRYKRCNETMMEQFYNNLFYTTQMRVTMSLSEGNSAYITQLMQHYTPFMLFTHYIMQLQTCIHNSYLEKLSDTTFCMVQKDDLYLGATINLIRESLKSTESLVQNFNLKMTEYAVKDIQDTFNEAYKDAVLLQC